jgi:hypothetical protein
MEKQAGLLAGQGRGFSVAYIVKKPLLVRSSRSEDPCALVYGSLDHLIRPLQERRRDRQAEGLGGLEVDDQFKGCRLLHR